MSKFATDYMFMGEDGTPITILAGCDGLTEAFFANIVHCKGTSHGYAEVRGLAHTVLSTGHQKVKLQSEQEPSIIDVKNKAGTHIPTGIVYEESPVGDRNANGSIERANQTIQGHISAIKDYTERQIGATNWSYQLSLEMACTTRGMDIDDVPSHQRVEELLTDAIYDDHSSRRRRGNESQKNSSQLEWAFALRCMSFRKFRPIGKDKNFKNFLEFVTVGVGVPAPVHESYQHDVVNGMLLSKDERVSTKKHPVLYLRNVATLPLTTTQSSHRLRKIRTRTRPTCFRDENIITVGAERFRFPEVLFQTSFCA